MDKTSKIDKDYGPEPSPGYQGAMCMRETAAGRLRGLARRLRDRAHGYEKLADRLEGCLDPEADEALWELLGQAERRA